MCQIIFKIDTGSGFMAEVDSTRHTYKYFLNSYEVENVIYASGLTGALVNKKKAKKIIREIKIVFNYYKNNKQLLLDKTTKRPILVSIEVENFFKGLISKRKRHPNAYIYYR